MVVDKDSKEVSTSHLIGENNDWRGDQALKLSVQEKTRPE